MSVTDSIPRLKDSPSYEQWKSLLETWTFVTKVQKKQQAEAIILTLDTKAQEVALKIDKAKMRTEDDSGFKELMKVLDKHYTGDENQRVFTLCDDFEHCVRKQDESVTEFVTRWENLVEKLRNHGVVYSEPALAYKLITKANLDPVSCRIIRSTVKDLTLESMKETILKVFDKNLTKNVSDTQAGFSNNEGSQMLDIKEEPTYYGYSYNSRGSKRKRGYGGYGNQNNSYRTNDYGNQRYNGRNQSHYPRNNMNERDDTLEKSRQWRIDDDRNTYNYKRGNNNSRLNHPDRFGNPTKCDICGSVYHLRNFCNNKTNVQHVHEVEDVPSNVEEIKVNLLTLAEESPDSRQL